jgi:uncharacterized protein involved in oxidation of intracellular sulfur
VECVSAGNIFFRKEDQVKVFLLVKGVECESLDTDKFKVTNEMGEFIRSCGKILACGTCLKIRQSAGSDMCPLSTMADLYEVIQESDKVLTF